MTVTKPDKIGSFMFTFQCDFRMFLGILFFFYFYSFSKLSTSSLPMSYEINESLWICEYTRINTQYDLFFRLHLFHMWFVFFSSSFSIKIDCQCSHNDERTKKKNKVHMRSYISRYSNGCFEQSEICLNYWNSMRNNQPEEMSREKKEEFWFSSKLSRFKRWLMSDSHSCGICSENNSL